VNFSNILNNIISKKLKTDISIIEQNRVYLNSLKKKKNFIKFFFKSKYFYDIFCDKNKETDLVVYIITINILKTNVFIHISDVKGNLKLSLNSGSVKLSGKQKRKKFKIIIRLINLLFRKSKHFKDYPVSIHLNNSNFMKSFIIKKLKNFFFIKMIKIFNQTPYNGCRKKKLKRKKRVRGFI
jgi:ribosomal protein S11